MKYRKLGNTGLKVSEILAWAAGPGLGTAAARSKLGADRGQQTRADRRGRRSRKCRSSAGYTGSH